ncbi:MAG: UTRA domain-containing protein, partial [Pseudomonadota bacterium]
MFSFVSPAFGPGFLDTDFSTTTPTRYLLDRSRPDELEHTVQAVMPDSEACRRLAIASDEPCLRLR